MILGKINNERIFFLMIFLPLIGTSIPAYIIASFFLLSGLNKHSYKLWDLLCLVLLIVWFFTKIYKTDFVSSIVLVRYYFGFFLFYLYFNNTSLEVDFRKLLLIISISVLVEAFLINTFVPLSLLPNYPKSEIGGFNGETKILGFFQRPYSIGTNSTVTSTIIMVIIFYLFGSTSYQKYKSDVLLKILSFLSVILLGSGTGYVMLLGFFVNKSHPFKNFYSGVISLVIVVFFYYLIFIFEIGNIPGLDKLSVGYLEFLYDLKELQIADVLYSISSSEYELMVGRMFQNSKDLIVWSDFAWLNLLECCGFGGLFIILIMLFGNLNKYNCLPMFIFLLGAFHYGGLFSLPGQLITGYLLSTNFKFNLIASHLKYI